MKKGVNLDELQKEAERLVKLLQEREPGLATWNGAVLDQLRALKALIHAAGL